jgi:hypothetical protein
MAFARFLIRLSIGGNLMEDEKIFEGWKEIMAAFGIRSKQTMKKKVRKYGIPILRVTRKPTISLKEVNEWRESKGKKLLP